MTISFDAPTPVSQLKGGPVRAFDPVTLRLAADRLGEDCRFPSALAGALPRALSRLADIDVSSRAVSVTIDTGRLSWAESLTPEVCEFTGYRGDEHYGVTVGEAGVTLIDARPLTRLPMLTEAGDPVTLWAHELDEEPGYFPDGFELLVTARELMDRWSPRATTTATVTIPALQFTYTSEIYGQGLPTQQRFAIGLNETGARVIARTGVVTGIQDVGATSDHVEFGAYGPVMMWFSEGRADLPFTVLVSAVGAWLDPGDRVNLDCLELPDFDHIPYQTDRADIADVRALRDWLRGGNYPEMTSEDIYVGRYDPLIWRGLLAAHYLTGPDFDYPSNITPIYDAPIEQAGMRELSTWFTWQARGERFGVGHLNLEITTGRLEKLLSRYLEIWDASAK